MRQALTSLTETETLGLHLLSLLGEEVELDFFKRLYPGLVLSGYERSFTESHKALFQKVKAQLIRRGILLFGAQPKGIQNNSVLEPTRFVFPGEFVPLLPTPFQARRHDGLSENRRDLPIRTATEAGSKANRAGSLPLRLSDSWASSTPRPKRFT